MEPQAPTTPSTDPLVGTTLGDRYLIQELVGEGGMGKVYLGQHKMMRKRIAVKLIHPQLLHLEEVVARFEREAVAAGHIEHPNAVAATDFGHTPDGALYLVMEFVEGRRLDHELTAASRFDVARTLHVVRQILRALRRAHHLGIVHRDIKPENVLLVERDGDPDFVKVLDFGIAKMTLPEAGGTPLTQVGMVYGTPEYISPEQATGSTIDERADLYAVGVLTYEMLAGRRPFLGGPVELLGQHVTATAPSIAEVAPGVRVPAALEALVMRLLAKLPEQRPSSATEVLEALDQIGSGAGSRQALLATAPTAHSRSLAVHPAMPWRDAARVFARATAREARWVAESLARQARRSPAIAGAVGLGLVLAIALPVLAFLGGPDETTGAPHDAIAPEPTEPERVAQPSPTGAVPTGGADAAAGSPGSGGAATAYSLGSSLADAGEFVAALAHYRTALQLRPAYVSDRTLCHDVVQALGDRRAQGAAQKLVRDVLRDRATDDLAEAAASGRRLLRRNARALLEELLDDSQWPSWLRDSQALRSAGSCPAKRAIVQRLRQAGDPRALPALLELREQRGGCGFLGLSDCMSCLRPDLSATITELQSRPSGG